MILLLYEKRQNSIAKTFFFLIEMLNLTASLNKSLAITIEFYGIEFA